MNVVFYDIRFQTSMGDDVEITTMDIQKGVDNDYKICYLIITERQ